MRFDGGISAGQAVTPAFDSLLAKLIVHGASRDEAIAKLDRALCETALLGVPCNLDYLLRILRHPEFSAGRLSTDFLVRHAAALGPPDPASPVAIAALVAAALGDSAFRDLAFGVPEPHASIGRWRN